jgi:Kef-type K+ transport system membrane component KefB
MKELADKLWNMPAEQLMNNIFYTVMGIFLFFIVIMVIFHFIGNWQIKKFRNKDRRKIFK